MKRVLTHGCPHALRACLFLLWTCKMWHVENRSFFDFISWGLVSPFSVCEISCVISKKITLRFERSDSFNQKACLEKLGHTITLSKKVFCRLHVRYIHQTSPEKNVSFKDISDVSVGCNKEKKISANETRHSICSYY